MVQRLLTDGRRVLQPTEILPPEEPGMGGEDIRHARCIEFTQERHVLTAPDGTKALCGGPGRCEACDLELFRETRRRSWRS